LGVGGESGEVGFLERDEAAGELQEREMVLVLLRPTDQDPAAAVQPPTDYAAQAVKEGTDR
jgi:hypothetical protein